LFRLSIRRYSSTDSHKRVTRGAVVAHSNSIDLHSPVGLTQPNYPKNEWWVAAFQDEVTNTPVERWIHGLPVVLFRGSSGKATALDGRCPHRSAPLAAGSVKGDDLVCGYHGFAFAADGRCVRVPTQASPGAIRVRSYPVLENDPFVWIWTGDPAHATEAPVPPTLDWASQAGWVVARGHMEVACNYLALKENVLDLSHFSFVHAKTLAVMDWTHPPKVEATERTVTYSQEFLDSPLPAMYGVPTGIGTERRVNRRGWGSSLSPAIHLSGVDVYDPLRQIDGREEYNLRFCHATTPVDPGHTRYWWVAGRNYGLGADARERMQGLIETAFLEDKQILEKTEEMARRDVRRDEFREVSVGCDRAGIEARRRVAKLLASEGAAKPDPDQV
jgi:nitrite reductase/ring-hydroxylating ferredoxin subunit